MESNAAGGHGKEAAAVPGKKKAAAALLCPQRQDAGGGEHEDKVPRGEGVAHLHQRPSTITMALGRAKVDFNQFPLFTTTTNVGVFAVE